jgi:hypothetical protein
MQVNTEEKKQIYEVLIIKQDHNHITVKQTDNYDSAFEKWNLLTEDWTKALKEKVPFILKDPIITAFDPGIIKEITVRPVMEVPESKYDNPYQKQMLKKGLSGMFNSIPDLLDEGYR